MEHGYVPGVLYEVLDKPYGCSSSENGVWIYERGGSGKVFIGEHDFGPNANRGGALSWDVCVGATFDNGHSVWDATGTKVGSVAAAGTWKLRWSAIALAASPILR